MAEDRRPILLVDFDGVCSTYESGWQGADVCSDPPVDGLFDWMQMVSRHFTVMVYSSRSSQPGGIEAMAAWFMEWQDRLAGRARDGERGGMPREARWTFEISFPREKPPAFLTIDDRCVRFTGSFRDLPAEELLAFRPWNR